MATATIISVDWIDAVADVGWEGKVTAAIHHCTTVGFLVDETDEAICLASTWSIDQTNARMHIPKAWIKNRKVVIDEAPVSKSKGNKPAKVGSVRDPKKVPPAKAGRLSVNVDGSTRRGRKAQSPC